MSRLLEPQPVKICKITNEPLVHKLLDQSRSKLFNVHLAATDKILQSLLEPGSAIVINAANVNAVFVLLHPAAATWAFGGYRKGLSPLGAFLQEHPYDLRDDFAGLFDNHRIVLTNIEPPYLVKVMQRRPLDGSPGKLDGPQVRNGRKGPGLAHLDLDALDYGLGPLGGEFVRYAPSRRPTRTAQNIMLIKTIDLDHHAVDLVVKLRLLALPAQTYPDHLLDILGLGDVRIHGQT